MHSDALESSLLAIFADEALTHLALIDAGVDALAHAATPAPLAPMLYALHTLAGAARSVGLAELGWLCGALEGVFKAAAGAGFDAMQRDRLRHAVAVARQLTVRADGRGRNQAMALIAQLDAMALQFPPIPHE